MTVGYNAREQTTFVGVVEDRMDPLKLRRVRVRCFHIHPEDKTLVPTEDLPWARVSTKLKLIEGDHVRGYFEDGPDMQSPVITEWISGIPETKNKSSLGFNDPRTEEQLASAPRPPESLSFTDTGSGVAIVEQAAAVAGFRLNEPQLSRLARGENLESYREMLSSYSMTDYPLAAETLVTGVVNSALIAAQQKITGLITNLINGIPGASLFTPTIIRDFFTQPYFKKYTLASKYTFPPSPVNPKYPYNDAVVSESGHIFECDDTPGAERIHTRHRSGTYTEYYPDGDYVERVTKDRHQIIDGTNTTIVKGVKQLVVEGSESVTVKGAKYLEVQGSCKIVILGDADISVNGNATQTIKGNFEQIIGGNFSQTVVGEYNVVHSGTVKRTYNQDVTEYFETDWNQYFSSGEWTLKGDIKAFRWDFRTNPVTNRSINLSTVVLEPIEPGEANTEGLSSFEFTYEPPVASKALESLEAACSLGDLTNFSIANAPYTLIKTIDISGKSLI